MTVDEVILVLDGVKKQHTGWLARCPAHPDRTPSLKIDRGTDGGALLYCFAGCNYESITAALRQMTGMPPGRCLQVDLQNAARTLRQPPPPPLAPTSERERREIVYDYQDELGRSLYQVVRREERLPNGSSKKQFVQRRRPRAGVEAAEGWVYNLDGVPRVLYNLQDLAGAELVYVPEGEKDVETLRGLGLTGTCNPGGAGNWRPEFSERLRGKTVVILPDNDVPGEKHAEQVAASLYEIAKEILILRLPGLPPKGDITDFVQAGGTVDDLINLVQRAVPWKPESPSATDHPPELPEVALYGLAGQVVRTISPHTEADPAALLFQLLAAFGCLVGKDAWFSVEATKHFPKLFITLVGASSKARKGASWSHICQFLTAVEPAFAELVQDGLSSAEGLIHHVRDERTKKQPIKGKCGRITGYQDVIDDEGATEKRVFVQEPEFARLLRVQTREGNTLSAVLRQAWDSDRLRTMTKNPVTASDVHVVIAAHITLEELRRNLDETETSNGFANRFLWIYVRRSKLLPFGGNLKDSELDDLRGPLRDAYHFAKQAGAVQRNAKADVLWSEVYGRLSAGKPGLFGSVTSRGEAQVMRLAMIYALLDRSRVICSDHLQAALAAWNYCSESAAFIFGRRTGDKVADKVLSALRENENGNGLSRTQVRDLFGRNKDAALIDAALKVLLELGLIEICQMATGGRAAEIVRLRMYDKNDQGA